MAVAVLETDTRALERDTGRMTFTLRRINDEIEGMYDAVRALDAMWEGPTNQAFRLQFRNDYENMTSLCQTVQDLLNCMINATHRYEAAGRQSEDLVDQIPI